ncbi:MAG: hypothetical protein IPG75_15710 [Gemmatimonadetes bacterium]|nr:hypothetical protein [Gemmatimonadota bacterium]
MTSNDDGTRLPRVERRIAVFNGLLLAGPAFMQGGLFGFGIGRVAATPRFAVLFIVGPLVVVPVLMYMYWRSEGRFD